MRAQIVTFTKENMSNSEKSLLSKDLFGYKDKSNKGKYTYDRKGLLNNHKSVKITNNTFIVSSSAWPKIKKFLEKRGAKIKNWPIEISKF